MGPKEMNQTRDSVSASLQNTTSPLNKQMQRPPMGSGVYGWGVVFIWTDENVAQGVTI